MDVRVRPCVGKDDFAGIGFDVCEGIEDVPAGPRLSARERESWDLLRT